MIRTKVLRGAVSNYVGSATNFIVWFLLTPFILESLGPTAYGLWVLTASILGYGWLLDLGVGVAIVKYVAEYRARQDERALAGLIATAVRLYAGVGLAAGVLGAALSLVFADLFDLRGSDAWAATAIVLLMACAIAISLGFTPAVSILRGLQRYDVYNTVVTAGSMLGAAATVAVLLAGGGVVGMVAVNVPVTLATQLAAVWAVGSIAPEARLRWHGASRGYLRLLLGFGSSQLIGQLAARLQGKSGEIVIGAALLVASVTPYALARKLSELARKLPEHFVSVLLPVASELHAAQDPTRLRRLYLVSTRVTLAIYVPVVLIMVVLGGTILSVWVGSQYARYGHIVAILTVASLFVMSQWPAASILQGMARYRLLALAALGSGVANLALSIVLVRPLGITGVALAALAPAAFEALLIVLPYAMRTVGVSATDFLRAVLIPVLVPAIPATAVLAVLSSTLESPSLLVIAFVAAATLAAYGVTYLVLGATDVERRVVRDVISSVARVASRAAR